MASRTTKKHSSEEKIIPQQSSSTAICLSDEKLTEHLVPELSLEQNQGTTLTKNLLQYTNELLTEVSAFQEHANKALELVHNQDSDLTKQARYGYAETKEDKPAAMKELLLQYSWMSAYSAVILMEGLAETQLFGNFSGTSLLGVVTYSFLQAQSSTQRSKRVEQHLLKNSLKRLPSELMLTKHRMEALTFTKDPEINSLLDELQQKRKTATNVSRMNSFSNLAKEVEKSFSVISSQRNRLSPETIVDTLREKWELLETGIEHQSAQRALLFGVGYLTAHTAVETISKVLTPFVEPVAGAFISAFIAIVGTLPLFKRDETEQFLSKSKSLTKKMQGGIRDLTTYEDSLKRLNASLVKVYSLLPEDRKN